MTRWTPPLPPSPWPQYGLREVATPMFADTPTQPSAPADVASVVALAGVTLPGVVLDKEELHAELRRHGFDDAAIRRLEAARPREYLGHRRCGCGALHPNLGTTLDFCAVCGWCRHPAVAGGICALCEAVDPPVVDLPEDAHTVYWLDDKGVVARAERS